MGLEVQLKNMVSTSLPCRGGAGGTVCSTTPELTSL